MKTFYEVMYRYFHAPWDMGPRVELVSLVESGRIQPGRAIDLGCGSGANAIYLAQHGFEVTGVDFAHSAIKKAREKADNAGVRVEFIIDDLTDLRLVHGSFDFLLDYGVLDDLRLPQRALYLKNILPLTRSGSQYLLWGFEYPLRWWEKWIPFYDIPFTAGEINQQFGDFFTVEKIAGEVNWSFWPPGYAAYVMRRK
ncbi:MAG TPA: class I SAM-dependent methyltransferase [Anaerolineaceae bacterium]|nr:class I SAM-dependent methyltransferase [Anaerolineaceae bacterium]